MTITTNGQPATAGQGPATIEAMNELHRLLTQAMTKTLRQPDPPASMLQVARALLADSDMLGNIDPVMRAKLERLHGLLVDHLLLALKPGSGPKASMLHEARAMLQASGVTKALDEGMTEAQALRLLGSASLPFDRPKH